MKKYRFLILLFVLLLWPKYGVNAVTLSEQYDDWVASCSTIEQLKEQQLEDIIKLLEDDDIKDRVNRLLESESDLEAEIELVTKAICYEPIGEDRKLIGAIHLYHSLLTYAKEIEISKDGKFKTLSITLDDNRFHQLDGMLDKSKKQVHIEHFHSFSASLEFLELELEKLEAKREVMEQPSFKVKQFLKDFADRLYRVIQSPVDKAFSVMLSYLEGEAEKDHQIFRSETSYPGGYFDFEFSIIEVNAGTVKQELMKEYYPTLQTFKMLKRWEAVTYLDSEIVYPKELVEEEKNWNKLAEGLLENNRKGASTEIYNFIGTGIKSYLSDEDIEILIRNVENIEKLMH